MKKWKFDLNCILVNCNVNRILDSLRHSIAFVTYLFIATRTSSQKDASHTNSNFYSLSSCPRSILSERKTRALSILAERTKSSSGRLVIFDFGFSKRGDCHRSIMWNCTDRGVFIGWFSRRHREDRNVLGRIFESWLGSVSSTIGVDGIRNPRVL